jgi:hypothetical protein
MSGMGGLALKVVKWLKNLLIPLINRAEKLHAIVIKVKTMEKSL